MYRLLPLFLLIMGLYIYEIFKTTKLSIHNIDDVIICDKYNFDPLCQNKQNISTENKSIKKRNSTAEVLDILAKQSLYDSPYKCELLKKYRTIQDDGKIDEIKYFEYVNTNPYVSWDDIEKLCKKENGFLFF